VSYFNGGLFAEPARVELVAEELTLLKAAAQFDWSKVRPEIFGTIFERSLGKEQRHATGAHFTSAVDIMKVVGPTIVAPWTELIESADTLGRLRELLARIENFTVLDPACGSGNFLYIAYRELKRLEARIYERMATEYKSVDANQRPFGFVSTRNFYGMDINPFAVDIAKVTMMLAHKLSIDELHINEAALPLDNLDANFRAGDALINADGSRAQWFKTDVIVGNPPFLGAKLLKPNYGAGYVNAVRKAYPDVPGMADFCVHWFRRAHDELKPCTTADPVAGRAGLVGTQNVRNNASRIGGLDHIAATGTIIDAVDDQTWSGEANVHVSIANWVKTQDKKLLPKVLRLWFKALPAPGGKKRPHGTGSAAKQYELDMREVSHISSSLSDRVDVSKAQVLSVNESVVVCQGITPGHAGFVLSPDERAKLVAADGKNQTVIHPYMVGDDILGPGMATRWIIDFGSRSIVDAQAYTLPFRRLKEEVLPAMQASAVEDESERSSSLNTWWLHWRPRKELLSTIGSLPRYLVCSRVTKRPLFAFVSAIVRPGDALQAFALPDDYSFGILQSNVHYLWFHAKCSNMKSDPRYTSESVFHTFPWPQAPTDAQVEAVAAAGHDLRHVRADASSNHGTGLRVLYRTLDLPGKNPLKDAHDALDVAVLKAYGFSSKKDLLQQVLDLNKKVAIRIDAGEDVAGPGVPRTYKTPSALSTTDCFGV
jgi:N-6 DNA Methylase